MSNRSSSNANGRSARARRGRMLSSLRNGPLQLPVSAFVPRTLRFISTSATRTGVTVPSLLLACGGICTATNSTITGWSAAVRITRVKMWCPVSQQGSSATVSIEWEGTSGFQPNTTISDTSVSVTEPAHISVRPPPRSAASFYWSSTNTSTLFYLNAPVGTIIEVDCVAVTNDGNQTPVSGTVAAGTLGSIYYLSLDPSATNRYQPVSLNTTA